MQGPTERQMVYRKDLMENQKSAAARKYNQNKPGVREHFLIEIALIDNLPTPRTIAQASAQIDLLLSSSIMVYAQDHKEWAHAIVDKLVEAWGNDRTQWPEIPAIPVYGRNATTGERGKVSEMVIAEAISAKVAEVL